MRSFVKGVNDLLTLRPDIAAEWHPTKNGDLTPADISRASNTKVWWRCKEGHEWVTSVNNRIRGTGCPICAGRIISVGFNDLVTVMPHIAAEWHPTKNGDLLPTQVTAGSGKKVWWLGECGHEWETTVLNRTKNKTNCPICSGKKVVAGINDLATTNPALAAEWHPTKNGDLLPVDVTKGSNKKVWWHCSKCGHEWEAIIANRAKVRGCNVCRLRALRGASLRNV